MGAIRIGVVAESRLFYDGLSHILRADPSLLIVSDVSLRRDVDVDVCLVDARTDPSESFDLSSCADRLAHTIVINAPDSDAWAADALSVGVRGLLSSHDSASDLLKAIHVVHEGGIWARRRWLIAYVQRATGSHRERVSMTGTTPMLDARLSKREREVFRHAATGAGNKELATRLAISEATVKVHMTRIFQKLGLNGRAELAAAYHGLRRVESDNVVRRLA